MRSSGQVVLSPTLSNSRSLDDGGSVIMSTRDDQHGLATASE